MFSIQRQVLIWSHFQDMSSSGSRERRLKYVVPRDKSMDGFEKKNSTSGWSILRTFVYKYFEKFI